MKVFVIIGNTGKYADRDFWFEKAYTSKQAADNRVKELEKLMEDMCLTGEAGNLSKMYKDRYFLRFQRQKEAFKKHQRGDPKFKMDYTGSFYTIEGIELVNEEQV